MPTMQDPDMTKSTSLIMCPQQSNITCHETLITICNRCKQQNEVLLLQSHNVTHGGLLNLWIFLYIMVPPN